MRLQWLDFLATLRERKTFERTTLRRATELGRGLVEKARAQCGSFGRGVCRDRDEDAGRLAESSVPGPQASKAGT